jgi:hypothetical protein
MPAATVAHPLGPPVVSGTTITVDTMLNQATRVTRMIMDLTLQRFIADRVFASAGGVTGGAVVYDQALLNELYTDRDVQRVPPGGEFPIITSSRQAPKLATVEKWGGKVFITDEARDRNNSVLFTNQIRQLANTIVRKINARAVAELEAAIAAFPSQTFIGQNWANVITAGTSATSAAGYPTQLMRLQIIYGDRLQAVLGSFNARIYTSNRVAVGVAYVVAEQQVGELRMEKPLGTTTWREDATERTWVQSSVRPIMYVTNPFSVIKVTGLGA